MPGFQIYDEAPPPPARTPAYAGVGQAQAAQPQLKAGGGRFRIYDEDPGAVQSPETAFAALSPGERSALAVEKLGPPEPASALEVIGNAVRGAGAAVGDIPAGILQLSSNYLPLPDSVKERAGQIVADYVAQKTDALDEPGGTAGYVAGQVGTAFLPGTGPLKVAANAGRVAKVAAHARPVAAGATLTAVKPYETEAERAEQTGISTAIGAAIPSAGAVVSPVVRAVGGAIRTPRIPTVPPSGKPPVPPGAPGTAQVPPDGVAPAGTPPGGAPPGGGPPAGAPPVPPGGGSDDPFIRKLKAAPESRRKGEILEAARELVVTPTPGQVAAGLPKYLEEQMVKLPGSRSVADKASRESHESYHRALGREMGLEDSPYLTRDVIEAGKKKLSDEYNEILPHIRMTRGTGVTSKLVFDANKLVEPFGDLVGSSIPKADIRKLANIKKGLDTQLANTGEITGQELKRWKTHIDEIANDRGVHSDVRARVKKFQETLKDTFARSLDETDPELATRLRQNDKRWANASILEEVQQSAGANVEGFVSGPKLLNAIVARYGNPSKAGNFGKLGEMGQMFFQKLPDSGTADRLLANTILTGGVGAGVTGLVDPATAAAVYVAPKLAAHAYYQTPAYQRAVRASRAAASAGTRGSSTGAGRTGQPEDRPGRNALLH
jgi:hypothetical protein